MGPKSKGIKNQNSASQETCINNNEEYSDFTNGTKGLGGRGIYNTPEKGGSANYNKKGKKKTENMYVTFLPTHQIILSKPPEICSGFLPDLYDQSMKANEYIPHNLHHGPHRNFEPIHPSPHLLESFLGGRK